MQPETAPRIVILTLALAGFFVVGCMLIFGDHSKPITERQSKSLLFIAITMLLASNVITMIQHVTHIDGAKLSSSYPYMAIIFSAVVAVLFTFQSRKH